MSRKEGTKAEEIAKKYLTEQRLQLLDSNYSCRWGEIDLIMRDGETIVFVEVKARTSSLFGDAASTVTTTKQQRIIKTALHYLMMKKITDKYPVRFDVIALQGGQLTIDWIKNAFSADC